MSVADRYRFFAEFEVVDAPTYASLARGLAEDQDLVAFLEPMGRDEKQPPLFFSTVNHLRGVDADFGTFKDFVLSHSTEIADMLVSRRTQTNEVGRCATVLPALAQLPQPLALIEVGASAGLNLMFDRFGYDYGDGRVLGDASAPVVLPCVLRNDVPLPDVVPEVVWARGIDLSPIDVYDEDATAWLESCVFKDHVDRLERLRGAIAMAREDPPVVYRGDLIDEIAAVVAEAPKAGTVVVFHSAVLNYLAPDRRNAFAQLMGELPVVWLSNEAPPVLPSVMSALDRQLPSEMCFLLGRDGSRVLAFTHHHGRWIEWLG